MMAADEAVLHPLSHRVDIASRHRIGDAADNMRTAPLTDDIERTEILVPKKARASIRPYPALSRFQAGQLRGRDNDIAEKDILPHQDRQMVCRCMPPGGDQIREVKICDA